jgi:hypothetical protein
MVKLKSIIVGILSEKYNSKSKKWIPTYNSLKIDDLHNSEYINEKNEPTNPTLWSKAIAVAKRKYDIYPSAYANGFAAKWYKERGGRWKTKK